MSNPRQVALEAIIEILERNIFADEALLSAFEHNKLNKKDRALATELIYGVTRKKLTIDYLLSKVCKRNVKDLSFMLRNILRLAVYQLEYTRIPEYAIVNTSVELTKKFENIKASSFTNGVLRNLIKKRHTIKFPKTAGNMEYALSIKYSHPKWLVKRWLNIYGVDNTINLLSFNNTAPQISININYLKSSSEEVIDQLNKQHIYPTKSSISPGCYKLGNVGAISQISGYYEGHWYVQDESSSLVVDVLQPQEDDHIIDLCAAPGTKTAKMAILMKNKGSITAIDQNEKRIEKIRQNCYRMGITNVECIKADGTIFSLPDDKLADKILLDAPCTNTGVLSKRADARWQRKEKDVTFLSNLQYNLISNAAKLIKPNGRLVYSVCSIEPEEGIQNIEKFINKHPHFELIDINTLLPDNLKNTFDKKYAQFLPFKHLSDGFFIACLKKHQ